MTVRGLTPEHLYSLKLIGSPLIAGDEIVTVVETVDRDTSEYRHRIGAFPVRPDRDEPDQEPRWLTDAGAWSDTAPAASRQGVIAFLSTRTGRRQAYLLAADGGLAALSELDAPVTALAWYDSDRIAVHVERPDAASAHGAPVEIDWLRYKSDGRSGFREPTSELWLLGTDGSSRLAHRSTGRITQLRVVGERIVTVVEPRHCDDLEPRTEIRSRGLDDDVDEPGSLLWSVRAPVTALVATARSSRLVAVSSGVSGQSVEPPRLWLLDGAGGARPIDTDHDIDCARSIFSDSRPAGAATLIQPVEGTDDVLHLDIVEHQHVVRRLDTVTGESRPISPATVSVSDFSAPVDGRVALCLESATAPTELYVVAADDVSAPRQVSRLNHLGDFVVAPERFDLSSPDGQSIIGLVYRPLGVSAADAQVLIRVHGGPHGAFGNTFDLETQVEVAAGFTVVAPNLRGSSGRGPGFRALSVGEWGRADLADLTAVSDWAVASGLGAADALHLAGGSYGAFLINWALTQTERYRSAISERSVSNLLSKWGTSDNGFSTNRFEFAGLDVLDDSANEMLDRSPVRHAARITTPLLLLHGEADQRCPIEQSEQLFVALRRLGRECRFVRFPGGFHGFASSGRPSHRVRRLELMVDWLVRHRTRSAGEGRACAGS